MVGSFTVKKAVTPVEANKTQKFDIVVEFTGIITGIMYKVPGVIEPQPLPNNPVTVSLAHDQEAVFTNIPVGVTYKVTETALTNWAMTITPQNGVIANGDNGIVTVTNAYTAPTGTLILEKKVANETGSAQVFDFEVKFDGEGDFTAITSTNSGFTKYDGGKRWTGRLAHNESLKFEKVPEGATYTIEEKNIPGNYTTSIPKTGDKYIINGTIDGTKTETVTNTYREYDVALKKWVSEITRAGESIAQYSEPDGAVVTPKVRVGDKVEFTIKLYNQTENPTWVTKLIDYAPSGYTFFTEDNPDFVWNLENGKLVYKNPPILLLGKDNNGDTAEISIVLTVTASSDLKNWAEVIDINEDIDDPQNDKSQPGRKVRDRDSDRIKDDDSMSDPGKEKDNVIDEDWKKGGDKDDLDFAEVIIEKGSLTLSKEVTGDEGSTQAFEFEVTFTGAGDFTVVTAIPSSNEPNFVSTDDGKTWAGKLEDGESVTFINVPAGAAYSITETPVNGYSIKNDSADMSGEITEAGKTVKVVNFYTAPKSSLTLTKKVEGERVLDKRIPDEEFEFIVTFTGYNLESIYVDEKLGEVVVTSDEKGKRATWTGKLRASQSVVFEDVTVDTIYEITEINIPEDFTPYTPSWLEFGSAQWSGRTINNENKVTVVTVTVLNTYTKLATGDLRLSKRSEGIPRNDEAEYNFILTLEPEVKPETEEQAEQSFASLLGAADDMIYEEPEEEEDIEEEPEEEPASEEPEEELEEPEEEPGPIKTVSAAPSAYDEISLFSDEVDQGIYFDKEFEDKIELAGIENGIYTYNITLKAGDFVIISGIPAWTKYEIVEIGSDADSVKWVVNGVEAEEITERLIVEGNDAANNIVCINVYNPPPPPPLPWNPLPDPDPPASTTAPPPEPTTEAATTAATESTTAEQTTAEQTTAEQTTEPIIEELTTEEQTTEELPTEPVTDEITTEEQTTPEETTSEPAAEETTTEEPTTEPPTTTETATTEAPPTEPPEAPDDLELFEFEDFEDLLDNATPLTNGWFAVELDDDWWEIFDENGVPLGVVFLPEGGDIEDYDLDFIEANIVPLAGMFMPAMLDEPEPELLRELPPPTKNPQTGDVIFAVLAALALTAAAVFIFKKRQKTYDI